MNAAHISLYLKRIMAFFCALMFFFSAVAVSESDDMDTTVEKMFKKRKTTGGMVVVAKDGEIVYRYCYGFSNKYSNDLVTEETYFKLASVSKLVTAVAVMKLVDEGRLDLDADIGEILSDPPYHAANPYFPKEAITCRDLMTHTAGINDSRGKFSMEKPLSEALDPQKNKNYSGFLKTKPGTAYAYSNYGAGILGCIIEAVTGKRLSDAARELVFTPMGIDAAYDPHVLEYPEKIVTTYKANGDTDITRSYRLNKKTYNAEINLEQDYVDSYGGLWMTGEGLCKIGILLCDGGVVDGKQILREDTVLEMMSSQAGKGNVTVDSPYGLNVERNTTLLDDRIVYGHQGLAGSVLCNLYFDPETHFVFALLTNGCNVNAKQDRICLLARDLFALTWEEYAGE